MAGGVVYPPPLPSLSLPPPPLLPKKPSLHWVEHLLIITVNY